jgi:hypothetical protein
MKKTYLSFIYIVFVWANIYADTRYNSDFLDIGYGAKALAQALRTLQGEICVEGRYVEQP